MILKYGWNPEKSASNKEKHGLPLSVAHHMFANPTLERYDDRKDYRETRRQAVGTIDGRILFCAYTDRITEEGPVRWVISLRPASRKERRDYEIFINSKAPS